MYDEPRLSDQERALVIELLERERAELPVEIHHTVNSRVREELHQRERTVRELLDRLRLTAAEPWRM
ncbi:MAG: hypothetical protein LLG00_08805 [Planctomycetaceae bacterium]|nr:hypothetical protein [Planctomycetaceae bacterium]